MRFGVGRVFDLLRGVDRLIWTIILSRAFGPGPLTGSLAILLTVTGTFGKLFSEALENVDDKQIEGIQSTGAKRLQRYRFGVIPQIMPVLPSQILYYMESNTRSATVVGAIVGGAIPREFINPVEKGIVEQMENGVIGGFPVVDVKVTLYDGSFHDVDSSEVAFKVA